MIFVGQVDTGGYVRSGGGRTFGWLLLSMLCFAAAACGSSHRSAVHAIRPAVRVEVAADASRVLGHRALAVLIRPGGNKGHVDYADIWVLAHGRLRHHRVPLSWPDAASSDMFALAPDGRSIAYVIQPQVVAAGVPNSHLYISQPDGEAARRLDGPVICALCVVSTPSWERDGRSFVISITDSRSLILRVSRDGTASILTAAGRRYDEEQPVVSPTGKEIAFFRSVKPASRHGSFTPIGGKRLVYVMSADGREPARLPFAPRNYGDLWWCGTGALCADVVDTCSGYLTVCAGAAARDTVRYVPGARSVTQRRHWFPGVWMLQSHDTRFAIATRKAPNSWKLLGGPIDARGHGRLAVLMVAPGAKSNPFRTFSVSGS